MSTRRRSTDDAGQVTVLIVGFAVVLLILVGVVIDASAAYLQRQTLDTLADGAALAGATLEGEDAYDQGLGGGTATIDVETARASVDRYLQQTGAYADFDGLVWQVSVSGETVVVRMSADLALPITVKGITGTRVTSTGSASLLLPG